MTEVQCVWPAQAVLGEAPVWCPERKALYWVDIDGKAVMRFDPATDSRRTLRLDHEIGCVVPRENGGFVAGLDCGLAFYAEDFSSPVVFSTPDEDPSRLRFNDGKCDRFGRLWIASTDREETEPIAALYRVDGENAVTRVVSGIIVGNGLGWSPDNSTMYFTDSGYGAIYAFDFDAAMGELSGRRVFAEVPAETGMPDGLAVDADGFVWSAHWGGWRVTRYDPEGRVDRIVDMPVPLVTSMAFGGADLLDLYVTTARLGMTETEIAEAPLSGGLFRVDAGVAGVAEKPFAG